MPRDITPDQAAACAAPRLFPVVLVDCDFPEGPVRLWDGIGDLVWGRRVFRGAGGLLSVSEVEETSEVRAAGLTLGLSHMTTEVIEIAAAADAQNRPARLWVALLAETGALLGDPVPILAGRMDTLSWSEGEEATIALTVEDRLIDLSTPRIRRYTDADQQGEFPGDLAFQYVPSTVEQEITW